MWKAAFVYKLDVSVECEKCKSCEIWCPYSSDVPLVSKDKQHFWAHKVILSVTGTNTNWNHKYWGKMLQFWEHYKCTFLNLFSLGQVTFNNIGKWFILFIFHPYIRFQINLGCSSDGARAIPLRVNNFRLLGTRHSWLWFSGRGGKRIGARRTG